MKLAGRKEKEDRGESLMNASADIREEETMSPMTHFWVTFSAHLAAGLVLYVIIWVIGGAAV
ncbi:hypothetical protein [Streptomyces lydicus]|uniref:hypothetical protein n=1 Tax=Streptomyces lydicus TaxID=47763 RepID=UPI00286FDD90|nr:hypothetical protein [Streptomyces lydicus]